MLTASLPRPTHRASAKGVECSGSLRTRLAIVEVFDAAAALELLFEADAFSMIGKNVE